MRVCVCCWLHVYALPTPPLHPAIARAQANLLFYSISSHGTSTFAFTVNALATRRKPKLRFGRARPADGIPLVAPPRTLAHSRSWHRGEPVNGSVGERYSSGTLSGCCVCDECVCECGCGAGGRIE